MSASHTATLPSTAAILGALRSARTCRQGILAGQIPARQLSDSLPHLPADRYGRTPALYLSPDTKLCAVSIFGEADRGCALYSGLHVYETWTGKLVCTVALNDAGVIHGYAFKAHAVQWHADSAHLSVVHGMSVCSPRRAVVYEAVTGRVKGPAWSPAAAECLALNSDNAAILSPDGKLLLCICGDGSGRQ